MIASANTQRNRSGRRITQLLCVTVTLFGLCLPRPCFSQESARKVISRTTPALPELAKRMHVTGKVKLEVVVTASGSVTSAHLIGGNPVFEKNAIDAVKQWKFEAGDKETKAVVVMEFVDQ
jgi:TonB family protein